jgi:hypothetical protein
MNYSWKRIFSGSFAAGCMAWALFAGGVYAIVPVAVFDAVALILIWNSEEIGGSTFTGLVTSPTPALLVDIAGWIVLSLPAIVLWHVCFH